MERQVVLTTKEISILINALEAKTKEMKKKAIGMNGTAAYFIQRNDQLIQKLNDAL